jgi:hypothetical protein
MRKSDVLACVVSAALLCAAAAEAQIYRWVDENGVVHYADTPHPGAEEVTLPDDPAGPAPQQSFGAQRPQPSDDAQDAGQPFDYESLTIASPAPEETLWNIEGRLNVDLNLQPALRPGHQLRVYFDGEPRVVSAPEFALEEVYRGTHNLQAEVIDEAGRLLIRSEPSRFYVQQTSIVNPN